MLTMPLFLVSCRRSLLILALAGTAVFADPLNSTLTGYRAQPGLTASVENDTLTVMWEGDHGSELRLRLGIERGTPTIRELAIRSAALGRKAAHVETALATPVSSVGVACA